MADSLSDLLQPSVYGPYGDVQIFCHLIHGNPIKDESEDRLFFIAKTGGEFIRNDLRKSLSF